MTTVVHGWRVGGLVAYMLGPGRAQEHVNARVIATWDGRDAAWQPAPGGTWAVGPALRAPAVAAGAGERQEDGKRGYVWHCSARVAKGDRVLRTLPDPDGRERETRWATRLGIAGASPGSCECCLDEDEGGDGEDEIGEPVLQSGGGDAVGEAAGDQRAEDGGAGEGEGEAGVERGVAEVGDEPAGGVDHDHGQ